jgi:hypothetical protein
MRSHHFSPENRIRLSSLSYFLDAVVLCDEVCIFTYINMEKRWGFFFFFFTCIGKQRFFYICTLLLYIERKGSFFWEMR